jgi:hypothetical protein
MQLDKVQSFPTFKRRLGEQDAVVGNDPNRTAVQAPKACDQGLPIGGLELVEARSVKQARQHVADIPGLSRICWHHACPHSPHHSLT